MSTYPNGRLSSTTFEVETVKIRRPVRAKSTAPQAPLSGVPSGNPTPLRGWHGLKRLDWRKWQGMRVRYSHGQDPHVVVSARGREWAYPWDTAIIDIVRDVANRG